MIVIYRESQEITETLEEIYFKKYFMITRTQKEKN